MTSLFTSNEKLQKLMNKEDTFISIESDMTAYRKSFKASCFLCHGTHLVTQCPHLLEAQAHVKKALSRARSKSRSKSRDRKSRRHHHRHDSSSNSDSTTSSESSSDSENNKKTKNVTFKSSLKKPDKEKKKKKIKNHAHTAVSDTSDSSDSQFTYAAYGAMSESDSNSGPDEEEKKAMAFIAAAEEDIPAVRELLSQTRARAKALRDSEVSRQQRGAQLSSLWDFDPKTGLLRPQGTQSGGVVSEQGESLD